MGMYDHIKCKQTDHPDLEFQTKDLENILIDYELTLNGLYKLTDMVKGWNKVDVDRERVYYTGKLQFYTHDENDEWVEYWALLDFGKVLWIKRIN